MKRPIVSREQLLKAAGKQRYDEGQLSFESSSVQSFQGNEKQATGKIDGFEVSIQYLGEGIEGACNCEVSDGFDFCHHCVHLSLHANKIAQQLISLSKGPDKSKVLAYLINLDKQQLAKQFLELIETDAELFQRYLLRASLDNNEIDYNSLKARITELTRLNEKLFSQRQVKHFFARIEHLLDELILIPYQGQEEKLLKLVIYAVQRINKLLDKLDDRANQREHIVEKINSLYQLLLPMISGRLESKVKQLFNLWLSDRHLIIAMSFQVLTSEQAWSEIFKQLAQKAWTDESLDSVQRSQLSRYLLDDALDSGDLAQEQIYRIALASKVEDWLLIANRWQEAGNTTRAIDVLEEQLSLHEKNGDILKRLIALLPEQSGALTRLKELFETYPLPVYDPLMALAEREGVLRETQDAAINILQSRNKDPERDLLLGLLIETGKLSEASILCRSYPAELSHVISLARRLREQSTKDSLALYQYALIELLGKQIKKADEQAAALLSEIDRDFYDRESLQALLREIGPQLNSRPRIRQILNHSFG